MRNVRCDAFNVKLKGNADVRRTGQTLPEWAVPCAPAGDQLYHLESTRHGDAPAAAEGGQAQTLAPLFHGIEEGDHDTHAS
jgi:hypothetical protein